MRPMTFPPKNPGLKWLTVLVGLYAVVWISLEGALWQAILLAVGLIVLGVGYLLQRILGGRHITSLRWLLLCSGLGAASGAGSALLTLAVMAVKTGLHGHGPEFTTADIEWVLNQLPLWTMAGLIAGLGLGLLSMATQRR
jgi:hypothetical protein